MTFRPLQNPEDMTPERRKNCLACYKAQDLYCRRRKTTDIKDLANIDRQLVDFLLELDNLVEVDGDEVRILDQVGLTYWELAQLRYRRKITEAVRDKLRIFASLFTYNTNGT